MTVLACSGSGSDRSNPARMLATAPQARFPDPSARASPAWSAALITHRMCSGPPARVRSWSASLRALSRRVTPPLSRLVPRLRLPASQPCLVRGARSPPARSRARRCLRVPVLDDGSVRALPSPCKQLLGYCSAGVRPSCSPRASAPPRLSPLRTTACSLPPILRLRHARHSFFAHHSESSCACRSDRAVRNTPASARASPALSFSSLRSSLSCSEDRCARHSTESRAPSPRCFGLLRVSKTRVRHGTMGNPWMPGDTSGTAGNPDRDRPRARFPARASGFLSSSTRNLPRDPFRWFGMLDSRVCRCPGVLDSLRAPLGIDKPFAHYFAPSRSNLARARLGVIAYTAS